MPSNPTALFIDQHLPREAGATQIAKSVFNELELLVLHFTEAMVLTPKALASLTDALAKWVPAQQVLEIMMVSGDYMLVCRLLVPFEVDLEDADVLADVERWSHGFSLLMNPTADS